MIGNVWSNVSGFAVGEPLEHFVKPKCTVGDDGTGIFGWEKWELLFD